MDFLSPNAINTLSTLLQNNEREKVSNTELVAPVALNPTAIIPKCNHPKNKINDKAIWDEGEVPSEDALTDISDKRPSPRYEICYKQTVGTEDTYLGMGDISPASFDCTELVIKVHFPGSTMKDLDLDVTKNRIRAESHRLRLFTYLPVAVKYDKGSAKFDPKKEVLTVVLPIDNELDG